MSRLLSEEQKIFITLLVEQKKTSEEIINAMKKKYNRVISKGTITKVFNKYNASGTVANRWSGGRPKLLNTSETKQIVKASRGNRQLTAVDIANNRKINLSGASKRTVQRTLNREGLKATTTIPRYVSAKNKTARMKFAEEWLKKESSFYEKIVFSDESDIFPNKCGKLYIRRLKDEDLDLSFGPASNRDSRTVKVWGFIGFNTVGPLVRYYGTLDGVKYLELLKKHLLRSFSGLQGTKTRKGALLWQQDNVHFF